MQRSAVGKIRFCPSGSVLCAVVFVIALILIPTKSGFSQSTITSIRPVVGQPGDIVTISGSGFSTAPATNTVRYGPNRAPVVSATATSLSVQVPTGQPLGQTNVNVN